MKWTLTVGTLAVLSACAGLQPPAPTPASAPSAKRAHQTTESGALLYALGTTGIVYVYTYPDGEPAGQLNGFSTVDLPSGICSDTAGDVFIASITGTKTRSSTIYEYQHGGTSPVATLSDEGTAFGCAVDPTSGNLAVVNGYDAYNPYGKHSSVAVYTGAQGAATMYYSSSLGMWSGTYDGEGNLYLACTTARRDRAGIAELQSGSTAFRTIRLKAAVYMDPRYLLPSLQWDGYYLAVTSNRHLTQPVTLYQLQVSGHKASVIDTSRLQGHHHVGGSWIGDGVIVGIEQSNGWNGLAAWSYPQGGEPLSRISKVLQKTAGKLEGVTISAGSATTRRGLPQPL